MTRPIPSEHEVLLPTELIHPSRIGRVVSVSGGRVVAVLDPESTSEGLLQVGSLVKIARPTAVVFGLVEGLTIPMLRHEAGEVEPRLAEISVLGEIPAGDDERLFRRGVSSMPGLDDVVQSSSSLDTEAIFARSRRQTIKIGTIQQDPTVAAHVKVDDLLVRHFAIVGATGTGKSCALALLLQGIIDANPNGHILLLDSHGEYGTAFNDQAEHLTIDRLRLPHWLLEFDELTEILFGSEQPSLATEISILRQLVLKARLAHANGKFNTANVTVDTPTPYTMAELNYQLDAETGRLNNQSSLGPLLKLKSSLAAVQGDTRYAFMFPNEIFLLDDLADILGQLFRLPTQGRPICRLDLSGISSEILNVVVSVVARLAFSLAVSVGQQTPLLLVCEEAHRYAPQDAALGFEPAKQSLARIAKEGRKYGISLGLLSQRPAELAVSILSQCSTVFAFRMVSTADQDVIQAALPEASSALVGSLPLLSNGEAVVVGEGVAVPMRVRLTKLDPNRQPLSNSARFSEAWQQDEPDAKMLERVVDAWRGRAMV